MKRDLKNDLARRYAQACVNVFGVDMQYKDCVVLTSAAHFLSSDTRILAFLQMPLIEDAIKVQAFERICKSYSLPAWAISLFSVLLDHKRTYLLSVVLRSIARIYMHSAGIESFTISSAHTLTIQQQEACDAFLSRLTHKKIVTHYEHDTSLIAGVRMQSDVALWEHSIKKQLRDLHHYFCPVGEDYES